jgi:hypothetical protein
MTEVSDQIKAGMRQLIADKGQKVNFISDEPDFWGEFRVSTFGWTDYEASEHTASYGATPSSMAPSLTTRSSWVSMLPGAAVPVASTPT